MAFKQFAVRVLLGSLRVLVFLKQHVPVIFVLALSPFGALGKFLLRFVAVPLYRAIFFVKRALSGAGVRQTGRPGGYFANRFVVHIVMLLIVGATVFANGGRTGVRAETFGSQSILYELVSEEAVGSLSVVTAADLPMRHPSSYLNDGTIDVAAHVDFDFVGEPYVSTTTPLAEVPLPSPSAQSPEQPARQETVEHIVESGDSLYSIAGQYGLNVSTLLWANDLSLQSLIRPGQKVVVPPTDGVLYKVKSGDTLLSIAKKFSADAEKIIAFNRLADANDLVIGEQLMLPGGKIAAPVIRRTAPVRSLFKGKGGGSGNWIWPTDWRVITQYFGWRHTGLDIDGDYSTHSYAAAPGTVVYAGWRGGYGLMVELDHGGGMKTRYAHHSKNYVGVGDEVKAGQALGQTGSTGRSTGTHLHFEVLKNGVRQNPLDYIR